MPFLLPFHFQVEEFYRSDNHRDSWGRCPAAVAAAPVQHMLKTHLRELTCEVVSYTCWTRQREADKGREDTTPQAGPPQ